MMNRKRKLIKDLQKKNNELWETLFKLKSEIRHSKLDTQDYEAAMEKLEDFDRKLLLLRVRCYDGQRGYVLTDGAVFSPNNGFSSCVRTIGEAGTLEDELVEIWIDELHPKFIPALKREYERDEQKIAHKPVRSPNSP